MAAIFEPHRLPSTVLAPRRPELRLVPGGRTDAAAERLRPAVVVAGLLLALLVAFGAVAVGRGALGGLAPAPAAPAEAPARTAAASAGAATVVVQPGDTFWSIARSVQPEGDVRGLVDELQATNGSAALIPGERIVLPS